MSNIGIKDGPIARPIVEAFRLWPGPARDRPDHVLALVLAFKRQVARLDHPHVVEHEVLNGVGAVAQDDARAQLRLVDGDVPQRDVAEVHAALRGAGAQRVVQRALLAQRSAWLVLLLRADPHGPPQGLLDLDVLVGDVCDEPALGLAVRQPARGVGLDVDAFARARHGHVPERDVLHACHRRVGRHAADGGAETAHDHVFHQDVAGAVRVDAALGVARLDGDGVVVVHDAAVVDPKVAPGRVDAIRVQILRLQVGLAVVPCRAGGVVAQGGLDLLQLRLLPAVHVDVDVAHLHTRHVAEHHVERRWVEHVQSLHQHVRAVVHGHELGPLALELAIHGR